MINNCMNCGAILMEGTTVCPVCRQPVAPAQGGGSWQQPAARPPWQQPSPYGQPPAPRGNPNVNSVWLVAIGVLVLMVVGVVVGLMMFIKSQRKSQAEMNDNFNHYPRVSQTPPDTKPPLTIPSPPPPPSEPTVRTTNSARAPISGGVLNGKAVSLPKPAYPPIARATHASGTVTVEVTIDESGKVISARAVSGHPLLQASAVQAAYQARFTPTLLSGQPVKVTGTLTYNYVLD